MPEPLIRPARIADGAQLAALDYELWSPLHSVMARPDSPHHAFFTERTPVQDVLVAEIDAPAGQEPEREARRRLWRKREGRAGGRAGGRVAGYIRLVASSHPCNAHVQQIQGLLVADWARGTGVARALLRAACDLARERGARRITLRVLGYNAPARALYASEGFVVEGVLPEEVFLDGQYVDDVLMGRSLL
ncbi:GNAT family N-acetyltransferase [Streptomyces sp. NA04227]|uniref:GNAT family N-acetyltransferase n=1 Tax=Streptomyces sp. NA04227 TaxID=2742136 RepID=UPI0015925D55|nr:GNAT family N-acetyltransferase [Streptomyces sp. NA04227]QKW06084.1 GNAT family N-acetyltransferase [Streptomyces sp. NA04227]